MDALVTVISHRNLLEHERIMVGAWNTNGTVVWAEHPVTVFSWNTNGMTCHRILLEHERNYGLGMDALVTRILLETRTEFSGCSSPRILLKQKRNGIMV